jgi:hypothetical protein
MAKSWNWCGARVKNRGHTFGGKKFTQVQATWTVPAFKRNPPNGETWYAAIFVGLDGGSIEDTQPPYSENLLQAWVAQKISRDADGNLTQNCHAWYLWDSIGNNWDPDYSHNVVPNFPVNVGDTVTVKLVYKDPGKAEATFKIVRGPNAGKEATSGDFNVDDGLFKGDTIEWIMERPAEPGAITPRRKLAEFDPVDLSEAFGFAEDGTRVNPNDGDNLTMENDKHAHNLAEATLGASSVHIEFRAHE